MKYVYVNKHVSVKMLYYVYLNKHVFYVYKYVYVNKMLLNFYLKSWENSSFLFIIYLIYLFNYCEIHSRKYK